MITFNKNMNFSSYEVSKLLEDNKLLEILNTSGKSTVWQKFLYLNRIESKDCIEYVICKTCKQALKHSASVAFLRVRRINIEIKIKKKKVIISRLAKLHI